MRSATAKVLFYFYFGKFCGKLFYAIARFHLRCGCFEKRPYCIYIQYITNRPLRLCASSPLKIRLLKFHDDLGRGGQAGEGEEGEEFGGAAGRGLGDDACRCCKAADDFAGGETLAQGVHGQGTVAFAQALSGTVA